MKRLSLLYIVLLPIFINGAGALNLHRHMWANYHQFSGNAQKAHEHYQDIFQNNGSLYSLEGYTHLLFKEGKFAQVAALAPKIDKLYPNNAHIQFILALAIKKTNNTKDGNARLIKLSHTYKENPDIVMRAAQAYLEQKEPKNALALVDDYLDRAPQRGNNFIFYYLKSQIYVQMQQSDKALASIRKSVSLHPRFSQGWLLMAAIEEQSGRLDQAIKGYTAFLQSSNQTDKRIEKHLMELVVRQNMLANDKRVALVDRSCMERALILFNRKQYKQALHHVELCIKNDPNNVKNKLLKTQIMTAMGNYDETLALLSSWIEDDLENSLWYRVVHILPRAGVPIQRVLATLEKLHLKHPESPLLTLYLSDMHIRAHNDTQAIAYLKKAERMIENKSIRVGVLYQMARIQYEHKQYAAMKQSLEQLNTLDNNFAPGLNLLAYYYATQEKQLDKAGDLIAKVLTLDAHNPHFIDTQALILYKQKKYNDALALLEPIAQTYKEDTTIQLHLAKTYKKLGFNKKATDALACIKEGACNSREFFQCKKLAAKWRT